MGKQVNTVYECDATNCGVSIEDPAEAYVIEVRINSEGNPGVMKLNGVLDEAHQETLVSTLQDNFGLRTQE